MKTSLINFLFFISLTTTVFVSIITTSYGQGLGLDLTPLARGCILGGSSCIPKTGVDIIDAVFGNYPKGNQLSYVRCDTDSHYWNHFGIKECKWAKQRFFLLKAGFNPPPFWPTRFATRKEQDEWENQMVKALKLRERMHGAETFECNQDQRLIFLEARSKQTCVM